MKSELDISRILVLSDKMLSHARVGEWTELTGLELERRGLISQYFDNRDGADFPEKTAEMIRRILATDKDIVALVEAGKEEMSNQVRGLVDGRKAQLAYASNSAS